MANNSKQLQFILFLDPTDCSFYSYCPAKGLIAQEEDVPHGIKLKAQEQLEQLKICLQIDQPQQLSSYQRRPFPLSFLSQRKFKYPVYFTEEYLPASTLENFKSNEKGSAHNDNLNDFIQANIHLGELQTQLERSKKRHYPRYGHNRHQTNRIVTVYPLRVNEVIRTINRVILQDYGIVITMRNPSNKLIFKVKDKNEYLYGNESIANYQFIRESLNDRKTVELQILEVSIYDKEQFMKFIFNRNANEVSRAEYSSFPWQQLMAKEKELQFFMWHVPDEHYVHPESSVNIEKLFSADQLIRNNEKIKLKAQEKKRLQMKKIHRYLWKQKTSQFLDRRRNQIKNKYIELQTSVTYSGQCFFPFEVQVLACNNLFTLFNSYNYENRLTHKKFLKFQVKDNPTEASNQTRLPSLTTRSIIFSALKRNGAIDITPYMANISLQFIIGSNILHTAQTNHVLVDNNQSFGDKIQWSTIARMPMETVITFKVQLFSREGDGIICGVGAIKLFDQYGYLRQGEQQIDLFAKQKLQLFKIGCIDKDHTNNSINCCRLIIKLPTFKNNVLWTLTDNICAKMLGYRPLQSNIKKQPSNNKEQSNSKNEDPDLERLYELLRYDPLEIRKYNDRDKELLRKSKKYYKHQSQKLLNYMFAVDWTQSQQVLDAYTTLNDWAAMKPIEALFLLNPAIPDEKVRLYAVKRMENLMDFEYVLYSNQITQALVSFETDVNPLIDLILEKCVQQPFTVAVEYFWQFKNRVYEEFTSKRFKLYLESLCMISSFRKELVKQVKVNNYMIEMNGNLVKQTGPLKQFRDKNKKFQQELPIIEAKLNEICQDGFLFPIRPQFTFKALKQDECRMFDSKKVPFSLSCVPRKQQASKELKKKRNEPDPFRVMFKYGDDLKQDNLILQMFRVFDKLWRQNGLDLKMNIYRTLATGPQLGFLQIVDAQNNSKIHKDYGSGLVDAFDEKTTLLYLENYNSKQSMPIAKQNFIRSSAAYLVATYLLGIGDRHSGNVMVQKNGKFFHIDFGHILGNFKTKMGIKRQRSPVLFTSQFQYVMGGAQSADYKRFLDLCAKAFNILRKNSYLIINLFAMMVSAQIPQLTCIEKIEYVTDKMALELSELQAAQNIHNTIKIAIQYEQSRKFDNALHEAARDG